MISELDLLVFNGSLEIDLRGGCYKDFRLKVYITVPVIESSSTGKIDLDITADEVRTYIDGTGNVTLFGSCISQFIETDGTGNYRAYDFDSEYCDIFSDGVGDVKVYVTESLDVSINSLGSVYYMGNPQIHVYDQGIGNLKHVN